MPGNVCLVSEIGPVENSTVKNACRLSSSIVLAASCVVMSGGCSSARYSTSTSLAADPAPGTGQTIRNFEPTVANYANGDTVTKGGAFRYQTDTGAPSREYIGRDVGVFAANIVTLPYTAIADRNDVHVSQGLVLDPTYTAVPSRPYGTEPAAPRPFDDAVAPTAVVTTVAPATAPSTSPSDATVITPAQPELAPLGTFTILGHVADPGTYDLKKDGVTLTQALAASGLVQKDPSKVTITLSSSDGASRTFKLESISADADPILKPGDSVVVKIAP